MKDSETEMEELGRIILSFNILSKTYNQHKKYIYLSCMLIYTSDFKTVEAFTVKEHKYKDRKIHAHLHVQTQARTRI